MGLSHILLNYDTDIFDKSCELVDKYLNCKHVLSDASLTYISSDSVKRYTESLYESYPELSNGHSQLHKELYVLYLTSGALNLYNTKFQVMGYNKFRSKILIPYLIYIMHRQLPSARAFISSIVSRVYQNVKHKYRVKGIDDDILKYLVLSDFLGSIIYKIKAPIDVDNLEAYYYSVVSNIYFFLLRRGNNRSVVKYLLDTNSNIVSVMSSERTLREKLYKKALYQIAVKKMCDQSLMYSQVLYNYNIFKNIIINNELQDLYFSTYYRVYLNQNQCDYKIIKVIKDDIDDVKVFNYIRQLPIIYRLMKCVHIVSNTKSKCYNEQVVRKDLVSSTIQAELMSYLKNIFSEGMLYTIVSSIAERFSNALLSGEYINPLTLSTVKINDISFLIQLRQFIRICLNEGFN